MNADDFGFFDGVSRGILEAARAGTVTATGVMANGPALDRWIPKLREVAQLDVGVHLNATFGRPLTSTLAAHLRPWGRQFPGKFGLVAALAGRLVPMAVLKAEWRAQIERCLSAGLEVRFLNSHEHVHALPRLSGAVSELAREYGIRHIRRVVPEWDLRALPGLGRSILLAFLPRSSLTAEHTTALLGVAQSGRLRLPYLHRTLSRLEPGATYELMCHPGRADAEAVAHRHLRRYHHWEAELQLLIGPAFPAALGRFSVTLIGYRHLA